MNWLNRFMSANCSYVMVAFLLVMSLICGVQIGQTRVQKAWDAEKLTIAVANAKQEQFVFDVKQSQTQITKEISNEFVTRSKVLADWKPASHIGGVHDSTATDGGNLSAVSEAHSRAASVGSDPLPPPSGDAEEVTCAQLSKDATLTTLMLLEMQRWYQRQSTLD